MSNAIPNRTGAINFNEGTLEEKRALFKTVFTGEVMMQFEQATTVLDKHFVRNISEGKSANFPVIGNMPDAEYHTPGEEILGQKVPHAEKEITIDKLLISHVFLADIDEAMQAYEVRSRYANMMGNKLATKFDQNVYREIIKSARGTSPVNGGLSGAVLEEAKLSLADISTEAKRKAAFDAWVDAIFSVKQNYIEKGIVQDGDGQPIYLALKPSVHLWLMRQMNSNGFSLLEQGIGGNGSIAEAQMPKVAGVTLMSTSHLPFVKDDTDPFHPINADTTQAIAWTPDAVGTVKLMDLSIQSDWDIRRQGTLMVARYAMGHGSLRNECAMELRTGAPTA